MLWGCWSLLSTSTRQASTNAIANNAQPKRLITFIFPYRSLHNALTCWPPCKQRSIQSSRRKIKASLTVSQKRIEKLRKYLPSTPYNSFCPRAICADKTLRCRVETFQVRRALQIVLNWKPTHCAPRLLTHRRTIDLWAEQVHFRSVEWVNNNKRNAFIYGPLDERNEWKREKRLNKHKGTK